LAADTDEKQPVAANTEEKQPTDVISESAGKSYLKGDSRMKKRSCQFLGDCLYKSSAVAEMGDHGHNRDGSKRGGLLCPFCGELGPHLIQCGVG